MGTECKAIAPPLCLFNVAGIAFNFFAAEGAGNYNLFNTQADVGAFLGTIACWRNGADGSNDFFATSGTCYDYAPICYIALLGAVVTLSFLSYGTAAGKFLATLFAGQSDGGIVPAAFLTTEPLFSLPRMEFLSASFAYFNHLQSSACHA
jgi:hypothetical protein